MSRKTDFPSPTIHDFIVLGDGSEVRAIVVGDVLRRCEAQHGEQRRRAHRPSRRRAPTPPRAERELRAACEREPLPWTRERADACAVPVGIGFVARCAAPGRASVDQMPENESDISEKERKNYYLVSR